MSPPPHWPHVSHYSSISPSFPVWHIWELVNQKKEEKRVSKWGTLGLTMWYCDNSHFQIYPGKQYYNDCEKHRENNKKFRSLIKIVPQIFFTTHLFISSTGWYALMNIFVISAAVLKLRPQYSWHSSHLEQVPWPSPCLRVRVCDCSDRYGVAAWLLRLP